MVRYSALVRMVLGCKVTTKKRYMQVFLVKSGFFPQKDLHNQKKSCNFAADLNDIEYNNIYHMETFLKYLGALLVLCGVICLAIYYFAAPTNTLLWLSLVLELVGILAYIFINKKID